jgi:fimbrial chaperone protein
MFHTSLKFFHLLVILSIFISWSSVSFAFTLAPIEASFSASGRAAIHNFRAKNDTSQPVAVEINIFDRTMDAQGQDELTENEDDFIVVPAQLILMPGEQHNIRVQYIGGADIKLEKSYRMIVEQLPIDVEGENLSQSNVRFLLKYVASLYVLPEKAFHNIIIQSIENQGASLRITLRNNGNRHSLLGNAEIQWPNGISLKADQLTGLTNENILAEKTRVFVVQKPNGFSVPAGDAQLIYTE